MFINDTIHKNILFLGFSLALFITNLDSTIVSVAIPNLFKIFNVSQTLLNLVLVIFLIAYALSIPLLDSLVKAFSDRKVYMIACLGFLIASIFCGISSSYFELILFRAVQGFCAGILSTLSRSLVVKNSTYDKLTINLSKTQLIATLGQVLGPFLGGYLIQFFDWRFIFFVNAPICLFIYISSKYIKNDVAAHQKYFSGFDWLGYLLFTFIISILTFSVDIHGYSTKALFFLILEVILLGVFIKHLCCNKNINPIIAIYLFKKSTKFAHYCLLSLLSRQYTGILYLILSLLLWKKFNLSSIHIGNILLIHGIGIWSGKVLLQKILKTISIDRLFAINLVLLIIVSILMVLCIGGSHLKLVIVFSYLIGVFISGHHTLLNGLTLSSIDKNDAILGSSITSLIMYLSQSSGIIIFSFLVSWLTKSNVYALLIMLSFPFFTFVLEMKYKFYNSLSSSRGYSVLE